MNINAKNYAVLRRAISANQFKAFVGLRDVQYTFEELTELEIKQLEKVKNWDVFLAGKSRSSETPRIKVSPEETAAYALSTKYLSHASVDDFGFLSEPEFKELIERLPIDDKREAEEIVRQSFFDYAKHARSLANFQKAEALLMRCAVRDADGALKILHKPLKTYHDFMQKSGGELKSFDDYTYKHTSVMVGKKHGDMYRDSFEQLSKIDPDTAKRHAFSSVSLPTFGATISGYKGNLNKHFNNQEYSAHYTDRNYSAGRSELADKLYSATRFTGDKKLIQKVIALVLTTGFLFTAPSIPAAKHAKDYNSVTIYDGTHKLAISQETYDMLKSSRDFLTTLRNSPDRPTIEQFLEARNMLDENFDHIFSDLVAPAFEEANPDCKVTNVETTYDLSINSPESPDRWITIEYEDENGDIQTERVTSIDGRNPLSTMFSNEFFNKYTSVYGTFDGEINLDYHFYSLLSDIKNADNFEAKDAASLQLLDFLETTQNAQEIVGAKKAIYRNGLFGLFEDLSFEMTDKIPTQEAENTNPTSSNTTTINDSKSIDRDDDFSL